MNRRVLMIAVGAAVLILIGWYFLLWSPAQSEIEEAREREEAAEAQEQQLQAQINRLRDIQRSEPLRRAQLETLRTAIPDTPNLGQFILDVNEAATRSGIRFISIAPSEPRPAAAGPGVTPTTVATTTTAAGGTTATTAVPTPTAVAPAEIALAFQIQGGYYPVLDFLNRLDRLPRLVVIDGVNVTADPATGNLTVGLNARMFVRGIPAGFAGGTTTTTTAPAATTTTAAGGAGAGGATTTTAAGGVTTTIAGAQP